MIIIKIDESKTRSADLPESMPESCFKCPFYYAQNVDEGCLNDDLGYSETTVFNGDIIDGDGNLIDDVVRPKDKCPLINIIKEEA